MPETRPRRVLPALPLLLAAAAALADPPAPCCFNNPRYTGVCQVTPERCRGGGSRWGRERISFSAWGSWSIVLGA